MKKLAALVESERFLEGEECKEITDDNDCSVENKTLIKKIKDCKPFIGEAFYFFVLQ